MNNIGPHSMQHALAAGTKKKNYYKFVSEQTYIYIYI